VHRQNGRFMRRMIETAPQDGKFVILEARFAPKAT
jgi:hypothetical protein